MQTPNRVEFEGTTYEWSGRSWCDARTRRVPPLAITIRLDALLAPKLAADDELLVSVEAMVRTAQEAKTTQPARAERLLRRALEKDGGNRMVRAILCSVLRERNRPDEALAICGPSASSDSVALRTTRAAALCDLERWEDAKKEIGQALAIIARSRPGAAAQAEAMAVVGRIKQARPSLYRGTDGSTRSAAHGPL